MDMSRNPVILSVIYCCEKNLVLASVMLINSLINKLGFTICMCVCVHASVRARTHIHIHAHAVFVLITDVYI